MGQHLLLCLLGFASFAAGENPLLLWPKPQSASVGAGAAGSFDKFVFNTPPNCSVLAAAAKRYRALVGSHDVPGATEYAVEVQVEDPAAPLSPGAMDEQYTIAGTKADTCTIKAKTVWGALRGMETLSQIVTELSSTSLGPKVAVPAPPIQVSDAPRFRWR